MKSFCLTVLILALLPAVIFAQRAPAAAAAAAPVEPKKFALVMGNSIYRGLSPPSNTVNDAKDISAVLQHLGFSVTLRTNITNLISKVSAGYTYRS